MIPEQNALIEHWHMQRQAIDTCDKITQQVLRDALLCLFDGMFTLEQRVASLANQEWKGARQIYEMQDELQNMRYKMVRFQEALNGK